MKNKIWIGVGAAVVVALAWFFMTQGTQDGQEVEYRYDKVTRGELLLSRTATGVLVPLTTVDVKSKAGGIVERLMVEEGTVVEMGELVASIDPRDTRALFEQAQADATAADARVDAARTSAQLTELNATNAVRDAEVRLKQAEIALARAREENRVQPTLNQAAIANAEAGLVAQQEALSQLKAVAIPQRRRDAETAVRSARTALTNAEANLERQESLYELGYAAKAPVEQAESQVESARANYEVAQQRLQTLEADFAADIRAAETRVTQAQATLRQARANSNQITLSEQDVVAAQRALDLARLSLQRAKDDRLNIQARKIDIRSAAASAVRSKVSVENAQVQLDSTQVLAPRSGVVTLKYLEEGTIIPPGTSTFSEGTSIVQIADVTRMFVECNVDETDISAVREGQAVRIIVEAYPGQIFRGTVRKVFPAAASENSITSVKVRVEVMDLAGIDQESFPLRPGMNASCDFVEFEEADALLVPQQALIREGDKTFVRVKTGETTPPEKREIQIGRTGNEFVEVLSGLEEGVEVVTAEINLGELRERLERIRQREEGGGLSAGGNR